jgi:hypothetical protein
MQASNQIPRNPSFDREALEALAQRLEEMSEAMGQWQVGGALIHKVSNARLILLGEAHRIRRMVNGRSTQNRQDTSA